MTRIFTEPSGDPSDVAFTETADHILQAYQGSAYGYFSGDGGVFNFGGLGQYANRSESSIQWVHVVPEPWTFESVVVARPPDPVVTPEPTLGLLLFWAILAFAVVRFVVGKNVR